VSKAEAVPLEQAELAGHALGLLADGDVMALRG
jgi:hypothetical protein